MERNEKWSTLKGSLMIVVVIGHLCQLYLDNGGALIHFGRRPFCAGAIVFICLYSAL